MSNLNSKLFIGKVVHHRFGAKPHRFIYRVFSCAIDLDELASLNNFRWFSVNRFNLLSFHETDYGSHKANTPSVNETLRRRTNALLEANNLGHAAHKVILVCYPRMIGYVFNPLSVYFCYNADNKVAAIIYEVSNTFGERHSYIFDQTDDSSGKITQSGIIRQNCQKVFYVSPFIGAQATYNFRLSPPSENLAICIRETLEGKPLLNAAFTGKQANFSDKTLIKAFIKHPLMTLKVVAGIHWEAFHLWRKGFSIHKHAPQNADNISLIKTNGAQQHEIS